MEDSRIIDLYFERNEDAVAETDRKYGAFCCGIALNILSLCADAEECVNDTYLQAWNAIPPLRPDRFDAWLGRVVRNLALNLWRKNHRKKRYTGMEVLLNELEDCIPAPETVEHVIEAKELAGLIDIWLASLPQDDRILFLRRYWNGERVDVLAEECGMAPGRLAKRLYKLRRRLKSALEKEGYLI